MLETKFNGLEGEIEIIKRTTLETGDATESNFK